MQLRFKTTAIMLALLSTLAFSCAPGTALALVRPMDFTALSKSAESVVVVKVLSSSAHWADASSPFKGLIVTDVRLDVAKVADGTRPKTVTVTQPGGVVGDRGLMVDNYPEFRVGETCVVFLDSKNEVVGGYQGKLGVAEGRVSEYGFSTAELGGKVRGARLGESVPRRPEPPGRLSPSRPGAGLMHLPAASVVQASPLAADVGVTAAVTIASVSPTKAIAGLEHVTITGSGFGAAQGTGGVLFADGLSTSTGATRAATTVDSWSDTIIVCEVPVNACSGTMYVRNGSGTLGSSTYDTSFSSEGNRWGTMPATYQINEGAPMIGEAAQIQAAMATWNAVTLNFQLAYNPTAIGVSSYPPTSDDVNSIQFASLPSLGGALAVNYYWYIPSTHRIVESDIFFNSTYTWGATASSGVYDLQTVALHELGHTVGLLDQYPNIWRVMGAYAGSNKRVLSADEISGDTYLYGANPPVVLPSAPTVTSSTHPVPATYYSASTASLSFVSTSSGGISGYACLMDALAATDPGSSVSTVGQTASFSALAQGDHYFHVRAISSNGALGPVTHRLVRVDTVAPATTDDHLARYVSSASIRLTPGDALSGVASTTWTLDGIAGTGTTVATSVLATHTLVYRSTDRAGNAEGNHTVEFVVGAPIPIPDTTPPTTTISGVSASWAKASVPFTLSATDPDSPVGIRTEYHLNALTWGAYSVPVTVSAEGTTIVGYRSTDASGNVEIAKQATIRIDKTAPSTTDDRVAAYINSASIRLTSSDALSGVASTTWTLDGIAGTGTTATTSALGTHTLVYRSTDIAGNTEGDHTVTFSVSATPGGVLGGMVTAAGVPLEGVTVAAGGKIATTSIAGIYSIDNIAPGSYSVTFSKSGYQSQTSTGVVVASLATTAKDVTMSPVTITPITYATALSRPAVSPSRPSHSRNATFTSRLTPTGGSTAGAAAGSATIWFYRWETRTVRVKVNGTWKRVKQRYWHLRAKRTMTAYTDGRFSASYKLRYSGTWKMVVIYSGPVASGSTPGYSASTSSSRTFTAR